MRLFTYCITVDDGAAPNPYFGVCTLAICKSRIRSVVKIGDWVVGVGSRDVRGTDYSGKVVYAMKVTDIKTIEEYDVYCKRFLPEKIPDINHKDYERRVGDCIYDFSTGNPKQRKGVHNQNNIKTDLSGKNVLLSTHFYYFGDQAIKLPPELHPIVIQRQGHKSDANDPYVKTFVDWIETEIDKADAMLKAKPQITLDFSNNQDLKNCTDKRDEEGKNDSCTQIS